MSSKILASTAWVALLVFGAARTTAQTCGSVITQSTALRADIGPCAGTALTVPDSVRNITLDLNGHTIRGTNAPGSAGIHVLGAMIFVTGPGTITGFENGVLLQRYSAQEATVGKLRLIGNRWGVNILSNGAVAGQNRIVGNQIEGPGEVGVRVDASYFLYAASNRISGQTAAGIGIFNGHYSIVEENSVTGSAVGIYFNGFSEPSLIRRNDVSGSRYEGIISVASQLTIAENVVTRNGRDGIATAGMWPGSTDQNTLIADNRVTQNGRYGIAVGLVEVSPAEAVGHTGAGTVRVVDNFVRQNRTLDLYWFGGGPNNCWSANKNATSDPATLPACY